MPRPPPVPASFFLFFPGLLVLLSACGAPEGELSVLTYNVAGLPQGLSSSNPEANTWQIGARLDAFELVLVQEDFWYHADLDAEAHHPYRSTPMWEEPTLTELGDGLNRFSNTPFTGHLREGWAVCNGTTTDGSDCLTTKGFSLARHQLAEGVELDLYNLHLDASGGAEDQQARSAQVDQLGAALQRHSAGRAVVVAGDTNLRPERSDRPLDATSLRRLLDDNGLTDGCAALDCEGPDEIDRILFRSSDALELSALEWSLPGGFVDEAGEPLSDHPPVLLRLGWKAR